MRSFLFILIFVLLLVSKLYAYSHPIISGSYGVTIMGATDFISVGLELIATAIGIYLSFTAGKHKVMLKRISGIIYFLIVVLLFWFIISVSEAGLTETLYSPVSPLGYLPIFMVLLGSDEKCWQLLKKIAPLFALIYFLLCYSAYQTFVIAAGMHLAGNSPVTVYLVSTVWWLAVSVVNFQDNKVLIRLLILALLISCALIAFSMTYRSWVIQSLLLIIVAVSQLGKSKSKKFLLTIIFIVAAAYGINYILTSSEWTDALSALEQKNEIDTRGFQYVDMFKQIPLFTWIFGGGMNATYIASNSGEAYKYIDNQYLFTLFHYGVLLLIPWLFVWLKGVFGLLVRHIGISQKSLGYVCILWLCALGGLSVYNVIVINPQNIIMTIALGRCYAISSKYK